MDNRIMISQNFSLHEFECKDGSFQVRIHPELVKKLQLLRSRLNRPVNITSAYRNPTHNVKVGGAATSQHLFGTAADIRVAGISIDDLAREAVAVGFTGIGLYKTFLHVDVRPVPARWDKR